MPKTKQRGAYCYNFAILSAFQFPDAARNLQPSHNWQTQVHPDKLRLPGSKGLDSRRALLFDSHVEPGLLKCTFEHLPILPLVFDDSDAMLRLSRAAGR